MWAVAQEKAQEKLGLELKDLKQQKEERDRALKEAQKNELELRAKARELEEKTKNADLEIARRLDEERRKIEDKFKTEQAQQVDERLRLIQEEFRKKELEKDKQMEILKKALDEAQRKSPSRAYKQCCRLVIVSVAYHDHIQVGCNGLPLKALQALRQDIGAPVGGNDNGK
jgi:hypothetical protein